MFKWLLGALLLAASPALAQNQGQIVPSGSFTPGHTVRCQNSTCTVAVDGGGSAGSNKNGQGYLTEMGITNTGTPFCINDALINAPGGYHQLCLGANALGGGLFSYNSIGGAAPLGLNINLNGVNYPFPGAGNGNVIGPTNPAPTVGDVVIWNGGTTVADGGLLSAHVATLATLQASLTATYGKGVWRDDYSAGLGAAPLWYQPETGTCAANSRVNDGGSCVNTTSGDGNSFYAVFPVQGADLRQWGAKGGSNADAALSSAITYACSSHVPILIPFVTSPFQLAAAHTIGNGSPSTLSSCNGVTIKGEPQYPEQTSSTTPSLNTQFIWTGAGATIPLTLQGPAASINLLRIGIDCANICSTGLKINNILDSEYGWLGVDRNIGGPAFILVSTGVTNTWGGGLENDWFHDLFATSPGVGGSGGIIGDTSCNPCGAAVITDRFERLHWLYDGNTAGTYGMRLGFVVQTSMSNIQLFKLNGIGAQGDCLQIAAPGGALFTPTDVQIDYTVCDTDVNRTVGGSWVPSDGGIHILGWSLDAHAAPSSTGAPLSTGTEAIWGVDGEGHYFGIGPWNWTPADASGASLTFSNVIATYLKTQHGCTVHVDLTYPSTVSGAVNAISGVPLLCQPFNTNSGVAAGFTNVGSPVHLVLNNAGQFTSYNDLGQAYANSTLSTKRILAEWTFGTTN